ncbi:hypothetical protein HDV00_004550 [Rhizophlyctis rosea]|nr:hypothetical protein HDV00_004550 [Rhizophlyctis rosea]
MSAEELASYQFQLEQVEEALSKDPDSQELKKLQTDLKDLISLYTQLTGGGAAAPASVKSESKAPTSESSTPASSATKSRVSRWGAKSSDSHTPTSPYTSSPTPTAPQTFLQFAPKRFTVGQRVLARYSADGKYYDAVIDAVPQEGLGVYTVTFKGYGNKEAVKGEDIKPISQPQHHHKRPISAIEAASANDTTADSDSAAASSASTAAASHDAEKKKKKKKFNPDGTAAAKSKNNEQVEKQKAWLAFATGGAGGKKAKAKAAAAMPLLKKSSIFKTPDDPNAKVGVVGSGKPMTQFQQRGKHVYRDDE